MPQASPQDFPKVNYSLHEVGSTWEGRGLNGTNNLSRHEDVDPKLLPSDLEVNKLACLSGTGVSSLGVLVENRSR